MAWCAACIIEVGWAAARGADKAAARAKKTAPAAARKQYEVKAMVELESDLNNVIPAFILKSQMRRKLRSAIEQSQRKSLLSFFRVPGLVKWCAAQRRAIAFEMQPKARMSAPTDSRVRVL
jgi:hypothetical protein